MPGIETGIAALDNLPLWNEKAPFSLDIPRQLCEALSHPQDSYPTIHVAGSNGKGTVCALIASILHANGARVGQFTSPHLSDVCERCLVDGRPVEREMFQEAVEQVVALEIPASFFEVVTAATFLCFQRCSVDFAVVEVGLGGRLDATNVISRPALSVITSISLDHTHILGESECEIAEEKAGIVKPQTPLIVGEVSEEVREVIHAKAKSCGSPFSSYGNDFDDLSGILGQASWSQHCELKTPVSNSAVAAHAGRMLGISDEAIVQGLGQARWPGRFELVRGKGEKADVLFDCAHNPDGVNALTNVLQQMIVERAEYQQFCGLLSILDRKDWQQMVGLFREFSVVLLGEGISVSWYLTRSSHPRSVKPDELKTAFGDDLSVFIDSSSESALRRAHQEHGNGGLVLVTGSLFLIGELREQVVQRPFSTIAR